ncbi:MAG TPA: hypothetical protein VNN80_07540 [Polyangiaceae bacterium]|jgi:hypothetical protein|nr:hypothetical protein [Polyangiaceae bacterium]
MKGQLASVFVIAAVACGGRGGDEPPAPVDGMTDVPQTERSIPVGEDIEAPQQTEDPVPVEGDIDTRRQARDPVPVDGRGASQQAEDEDPAPVPGSAGPQPDVEKWQARAPERYVIRTCGQGAAIPSCSIEAVDEGRLVSRSLRFLPDEPWEPAPIDDGQDPVADLFDEAGRSIDGCTTSFELDPVYGYPSQIYFSCAQEGWGLRVTCFEPDTVDGSRCE